MILAAGTHNLDVSERPEYLGHLAEVGTQQDCMALGCYLP